MVTGLRFHHIGYAVKSLQKAKERFATLGYTLSDDLEVDTQDALVAYARKDGSPLVELLEPMSPNSPVQKMIDVRPGVYHICFAVNDINASIEDLQKEKFVLLAEPVPGHGLDDALTSFLFHRDIGLIQLAEIKDEE